MTDTVENLIDLIDEVAGYQRCTNGKTVSQNCDALRDIIFGTGEEVEVDVDEVNDLAAEAAEQDAQEEDANGAD